MPCVNYEFQSLLSYDLLRFEGLHISERDPKIFNTQTDEEYTDDGALIPNNTSVIVRRMSVAGLKSTNRRFAGNQACPPAGGSSQTRRVGDSSHHSLEQLLETEDLAEATASEEDKLKAVMYQSSLCYYSSSDAMKLLGLLPASYICFRCGIPGHHTKHCPSNRDSSFPSRIPHSFLVEVEDPGNAEAYAVGKKESPPFTVQTEPSPSLSSADRASSGWDARGKRPRSRSPADVPAKQKRSRR